MATHTYIVSIQATRPDGPDEHVLTANTTLTTSRPFSDSEIRAETLAVIAARTGHPVADLEVVRCDYTAMPAS